MWESLILERMQDWQYLGYALLFIGMVVEGEVVLLAAVFLSQTGHMQLPYVLLVSFFGMVIGDSLWYWFGHYLDRFLFAKKIANGILPALDKHLQTRPTLSIFVAKFIYFLHRIVLVRARPCGIPFKKFFTADLVAIIAWIFTSTVLGIFFAASFSLLKGYIKYAELGLLLVIIILIAGEHYLSLYYKKRLIRKEGSAISPET